MIIKTGFKSDRGAMRHNNEDSCFVMPKEQFYMVADGVGGNNAGEQASSLAVSSIAEYIKANPLDENANDEEICRYINNCVEMANSKVIEYANSEISSAGMATTLVVCHIKDDKAFFGNVGDSRAYIFRKGKLCQVTEDHSYVNKLLKGGIISEEEARTHSQRNMITKALGAEETVNGDLFHAELEVNDTVLLCTDGLYGELTTEEIEEIIETNDNMFVLTEKLIKKANDKGGKDNITVVCLKIEGGCQYE